MSTSDKCLYSPTFCVYDLDYSDNGLSIHLHSFLTFENNGYPPPPPSHLGLTPSQRLQVQGSNLVIIWYIAKQEGD